MKNIHRKIILLPFIIIISFAAGFIFLVKGCLQTHTNYGVVDVPVLSANGQQLTAMIAENDATTYSENPSYRKTNYSTTYWLKQFDIRTGKLIKKKKLATAEQLNNQGVSCYGSFDNRIWLYGNGLHAYDMNSLEEVVNDDKLVASNSLSNDNFPFEERLINAFVQKGYLDFVTYKGEKYRLHLKTLKITNQEKMADLEGEMDENINSLIKKEFNYGVRCTIVDKSMLAFAKDSVQAASYHPYNRDISEVSYRMRLFTSGYSIRLLGNHTTYTFANAHPMGKSTYLNPVFAKNNSTGKSIYLSNPGGFLVIHQDILGSKSKALITRIDTANEKIWESATSISTKISSCIANEQYCILTGNTDYMFSPHIGSDAICIVDIKTGKTIKVTLDQ